MKGVKMQGSHCGQWYSQSHGRVGEVGGILAVQS